MNELINRLEHMNLVDGDVINVSKLIQTSHTDPMRVFETINNWERAKGINVLVVFEEESDGISKLDESTMRTYGWIKKEELERLHKKVAELEYEIATLESSF